MIVLCCIRAMCNRSHELPNLLRNLWMRIIAFLVILFMRFRLLTIISRFNLIFVWRIFMWLRLIWIFAIIRVLLGLLRIWPVAGLRNLRILCCLRPCILPNSSKILRLLVCCKLSILIIVPLSNNLYMLLDYCYKINFTRKEFCTSWPQTY